MFTLRVLRLALLMGPLRTFVTLRVIPKAPVAEVLTAAMTASLRVIWTVALTRGGVSKVAGKVKVGEQVFH